MMLASLDNSSFSRLTPALQLAWDSTSLGALKTCPRLYYYTIVCGYVPRQESVHLKFGLLVHSAKETYDAHRANGASHEDAVLAAVRLAMCETWDQGLKRPWSSDNQYKNRFTLIRTIVWYFEEYKDDPIRTVRLATGRAAVELSFSFDTPYRSRDGERFLLCGHMDRIGELGTQTYTCDVKTSKYTLDEKWFAQFSPHNQFTLYALAAHVAYNTPVSGLIVDGIQVAVTFSRFERRQVYRDASQLDEWYKDFGIWIKQAEGFALANYWPMNELSCDKWASQDNPGGCAFRRVCSHAPSVREKWLEADFTRRIWDPLKRRGDI